MHIDGTMAIPRLTLRADAASKDHFVCAIAHEIAQARDAHIYQYTKLFGGQVLDVSAERKMILNHSVYRQFQGPAGRHRQVWEVPLRAGRPSEMREKAPMLLNRSSGGGLRCCRRILSLSFIVLLISGRLTALHQIP